MVGTSELHIYFSLTHSLSSKWINNFTKEGNMRQGGSDSYSLLSLKDYTLKLLVLMQTN
jgi:hypothetical protein